MPRRRCFEHGNAIESPNTRLTSTQVHSPGMTDPPSAKRRGILVVWLAATLLSGCSGGSNSRVIEREVAERLSLEIKLGQPIGAWIQLLGTPSLVSQSETFDSFYYWEAHGLGAYCHPNYEGQFRYRKSALWTVTTMYLAVRTNLVVNLPGSATEATLKAQRILIPEETFRQRYQNRGGVSQLKHNGEVQLFVVHFPFSIWDFD